MLKGVPVWAGIVTKVGIIVTKNISEGVIDGGGPVKVLKEIE